MAKRAKASGDAENDLDRGLQLQFVIGGRGRTSRWSETPIGSYPKHPWPVITFREMLTHAFFTLSGAQRFLHRAQIGETHLRILAG